MKMLLAGLEAETQQGTQRFAARGLWLGGLSQARCQLRLRVT